MKQINPWVKNKNVFIAIFIVSKKVCHILTETFHFEDRICRSSYSQGTCVYANESLSDSIITKPADDRAKLVRARSEKPHCTSFGDLRVNFNPLNVSLSYISFLPYFQINFVWKKHYWPWIRLHPALRDDTRQFGQWKSNSPIDELSS
jgi:hypothetical protein